VKADVLPAEQVEIWRKEALRACQKITEHLARVPFYLRASEQGFVFCPATLSAALWQRFAAEVAGIHPTRCPAPNCVRWFLRRSAARSDKRFCSNACKNRAFRRNQNAQ
jgi:predicted RNA-binding Zn ribbon-like protein